VTDLEQRVAGMKADYETCFGCGTRNPIGLQIGGFALSEGAVTAQFSPRADYHGFGLFLVTHELMVSGIP